MKKLFSSLAIVAALSFMACNNEKKDDKAETKTDAPQKVETPGAASSATTAVAVTKAHVCDANCKDGQHVYAHNEVGHTCTAACGNEHACTAACKDGSHTYAHGEIGHTCTEACMKM